MGSHGGEGLTIDGPHGPVRLKWHKLRRRPEDFPFDRNNLWHAVVLGASCEVDLQRLGDDGFACLHDDVLDRETTGTGALARADSRTIRTLRLRHPETDALGDPPLMLEDVAKTLDFDAVHRNTVVQLDLKDDEPAPARALDRFAAVLDGCADRFVASGMSWQAVTALGRAVPILRLGFDPLYLANEMLPGGVKAYNRFARKVVAMAPEAETIYLPYRLIAAAAAIGAPIVEIFRSEGLAVDCWTLDPDHEMIRTLLPLVIETGVDQITTNAPLALEALWHDIAAGSGG